MIGEMIGGGGFGQVYEAHGGAQEGVAKLVPKWSESQIPACKSRGHVIAGRTTDGLASAIAITRELLTKTT